MAKTPKDYYSKNPEAYRSASKRWREKNKEQIRTYKRELYQRRRNDPEFQTKRRERWQRWYAANKTEERHKSARNHLRRKYNLSRAEAEQLMQLRSKGCQVCTSKIGTAVDHCHTTGRIRGILCRSCNSAIGYAKDRPDTLEALAHYLRAHIGS